MARAPEPTEEGWPTNVRPWPGTGQAWPWSPVLPRGCATFGPSTAPNLYLALGGTAVTAIVRAGTLLACSVPGTGRAEQASPRAKLFAAMTAGH